MKRHLHDEKGMALVFATMAVVVIAASMALMTTRVTNARIETNHAYNDILLEETAQAGIDYAIKTLWRDYIDSSGNTTRNWASYRYYLDSVLEIPKNEDLNFNGTQDLPHEAGDGRGGFDTYPENYDKRGWKMLENPLVFSAPESNRPLGTIEQIHVARYDTPFEAYLTIRATAAVEGRQKTAVQVLRVGGAELTHTQFAILANNVNCILCHAQILNLNLERNNDPSKYNDFDRVKIAALESLMIRTNENINSRIAGTMYTRGEVYNHQGNLLNNSQIASSSFNGFQLNSNNGKIVQNSSGAMNQVSLQPAGTDSEGNLEQFANLYRNYPEDPDLQTDGSLPNSFPAPYPDENSNRFVDDEEFEVIRNAANGSIEMAFGEPQPGGSITSGVAYGVPKGSIFTGNQLPPSSNSALAQLQSGYYDGHLILVGTNDDPIVINNTVAVDGDLMIKGKIQGEGQLLVRGNAYILGDVTYADDPGHFGKHNVQPDGSYDENAFALVAGGSIMMGDYLTVRGVNERSQDGQKYPNHSRHSIHVRDQHRSNTYSGQKLDWGYFDPWSSDPNEIVPGKPGQQFSFTMSELQLFNRMELKKALDDPSYTPRFYGLRESQPDNLYIYTHPKDEHSVRYTETHVKLIQDHLAIDLGWNAAQVEAFMNNSAIHYLNPEGNWFSEDTLRNIWYQDEMSRPSSYRDFQFDGLLYSNNSIFAITRSKTRHQSNSNGRMTIRGGIIAADLGIFVPGPGGQRGLHLYYDDRVERFLEVRDSEVVTFTRSSFYFAPGDGMPDV